MGFTTLEAVAAALAADEDAMTAVVVRFPVALIRWCRTPVTVPPGGTLALERFIFLFILSGCCLWFPELMLEIQLLMTSF